MASPMRWYELGRTLGDGEGQGSLVLCSPQQGDLPNPGIELKCVASLALQVLLGHPGY